MRPIGILSPDDVAVLYDELQALVACAGAGGGSLSPSVYETAQVLRFWPAPEGAEHALTWLLQQQRPDGGWGDPPLSLYRIVPTLAALLAIRRHRRDTVGEAAVAGGLAFLCAVARDRLDPLPDAMPIAFELVLPKLLADAATAALPVDPQPYAQVEALGRRRRAQIAVNPMQPHAPPYVSWEAWGEEAQSGDVLQGTGVGHSPAATAWWLHLAAGRHDLAQPQHRATEYLRQAAAATGCAVPGVVPSFWPVTRFEQAFLLHILLVAGLLDDPALQARLCPQLESLSRALTPCGLGFSDSFVPDGDDTAAAVAVLQACGYAVSPGILAHFQHERHYSAYPFELHTSLTVTARAAHALAAAGEPAVPWQRTVMAAQHDDGWWYGDKWNASRYYSTCLALLALQRADAQPARRLAQRALLAAQQADGGWGSGGATTQIDSAYALLALAMSGQEEAGPYQLQWAIARGRRFLWQAFCDRRRCQARTWVGKDLFYASRIDRATVLAALLLPHAPRVRSSRRWVYGRARAESSVPA